VMSVSGPGMVTVSGAPCGHRGSVTSWAEAASGAAMAAKRASDRTREVFTQEFYPL
jgi:hypothetical protein